MTLSRQSSPAAPAPAVIPELPALQIEPLVREALREDLGRLGDLTTQSVVPVEAWARAAVVARAAGRVAGLPVVAAVFRTLDPRADLAVIRGDGSDVAAGEVLAHVEGPARSVLTAERVALNFLGRLCGIATATRDLVALAAPHRARVTSTRKTTPLLRALELYAVRAGGGANHRAGLDDAVLIKDNHLALAGGIAAAVARARAAVGHMVKIEVEVDTLEQLEQALELEVDAVLLDNMTPAELAEAVARRDARVAAGGRRVTLEASGGINAQTLPAVAASGVDLVSVGWLTHSAPALDVALDVVLG
jgi:nicotinate-nucleotide pyrophosphorylase (carboxylating)